ncbi:MAG TPA: GGDEF domain-containing phosphodiesterase, partial [Candidatus Dormibacteraeota bacterium]|nr:GGDEF domain-containing phosphodiesterase [Candidatus Dormibacteraeota bacterium]
VTLTASVGIALASAAGDDPETLVRQADLAMYAAKHGGGGHWRLYGPALGTAAVTQQRMARALAAALRHPQRQGLHLTYQPVLTLDGHHPISVRAAPHWEHRSFGSVPPIQLAAAAAEAGLLPTLGEWILDQALADLRGWRDRDGRLDALAVVIELSPPELVDPGLPERIAGALGRHGLPPGALVIRLSQAALLPHWRAAIRLTLDALAGTGVVITLDDSPRAQSVIDAALDLPISRIGVSAEMVQRLPGDRRARALVRALAAVATELGMNVVAAGVDTEEQAAALAALGCRFGNGHLYGPPVPAAELPGRLAALRPGPADPAPGA